MLNRLIRSSFAAALVVVAGTAGAASFSATEYTVDYDDSTAFGGVSFTSGGGGNTFGFGWHFPAAPNAIVVESDGAGTVSSNFNLPSFTITANAGYTLNGALSGFLGNLSYTAIRGAEIGGSVNSAMVSIDGGPATAVDPVLLSTTGLAGSSGILSATQTYSPGAVTSIRLSGAVLTLMASATGAQYASITGQPQNEFSITFTAAPVPEPESYAMLGAGLFLIGAIVRRRRS